ncbi:MAG: glycosyltransferase family 2 protein [Pseudomonadota bacterium]
MSQDQAQPEFSIVIVNYNGGDYIEGALRSLARQTVRDFEVILVDNASQDGSIDGLDTSALPAFELMRQSTNLGFAAANNLAAKRGRGRWLVLLNPDAEAADDWLAQLKRGFSRYPDVKVFACAQFDLHHEGQLDGAGDAYLAFGIPWRGGFGCPAGNLPDEGTCFSPCGASAVFDMTLFLEHGGFDERFFCYCEDVDLGFRMQLAGEPCVFLPDAVVHHAGGGLAGRVSEFALFHGSRNRVWAYFKNMPLPLLVLTLPGHLGISIYILLRGLMTGRARDTWRGMIAGVQGLGDILRPSPWSPPSRRVSLIDLSRAMAWNPLRITSRKPHVRPIPRQAASQTSQPRAAR